MSYCFTYEETRGGIWLAQGNIVKGNDRAQIENSWLKSSTSVLVLTWAISAQQKAVLWMKILIHWVISKHLP